MAVLQPALLLLASGAGFCGLAHAADDSTQLTVTSGIDYSSGYYGDKVKTEIVSVPLVVRYDIQRWQFKLTLPYVTLRGPGNVVPSIGQVSGTPATNRRTTQSGVGDVVTSATYSVFQQGRTLIDLTGKIKFATADESKGLGTGENDYAAQADLYQGFGKFTAIATLGYRDYGNTRFGRLDNVFYGSLGGSYKLAPATSIGAIYDYRPRITATGAAVSEVTAFATHKISNAWKVQTYLVGGFADGSPDYGGGALLSYGF